MYTSTTLHISPVAGGNVGTRLRPQASTAAMAILPSPASPLASPPAFASPLLPSGPGAAFCIPRCHSLLHHSDFSSSAHCLLLFPQGDAMGVDFFSGRGVGFGFGIGCGFGIGWGFGGAPLNVLGVGAGGGCGIGLGLGWGFGAAYGTKYLDSKLRFEGIDFDKVKGEHLDQKRLGIG